MFIYWHCEVVNKNRFVFLFSPSLFFINFKGGKSLTLFIKKKLFLNMLEKYINKLYFIFVYHFLIFLNQINKIK